MQTLQGGAVILFVDGEAVLMSTSHSFNMSAEAADCSSKDSGRYKDEEVTRIGWDFSCDALVAVDGSNLDTLIDKIKAAAKVDVILGKPSNYSPSGIPEAGWTAPTSGVLWKGKANVMSISANFQNGAVATCSASFTGCGELKKV